MGDACGDGRSSLSSGGAGTEQGGAEGSPSSVRIVDATAAAAFPAAPAAAHLRELVAASPDDAVAVDRVVKLTLTIGLYPIGCNCESGSVR